MIENSVVTYEELGQGNYRKEISVKPLHYFRDGLWRPIENQLGSSGDPNFTIGSDELFNFRIRNRLSTNSPLIHINKNDDSVEYTPLNTNDVGGIVNGNSIKFIEAWNNADLEIILNGHMIKKNIYLRAGHPQYFSFRIDEKINLDNDLKGSEFYINNPYLYKEGKETISLTWDKTIQDGKIVITVVLPEGSWEGWTLDPTYTSQPDGTAGIDVRLSGYSNLGTSDGLGIFNFYYSDSWFDIQSGRASTLIKFDLSTISAGSTISSANLYLRCYNGGGGGVDMYRTLRDWVETEATASIYKSGSSWASEYCTSSTLDYNNSLVSNFTSALNDNTATLSTSLIQAMIPSGGFTNNGFVLHQFVADNSDIQTLFYSSDYTTTTTYRPKLTIVYTESGGSTARVFGPAIQSM